jgi:hypothetical protein
MNPHLSNLLVGIGIASTLVWSACSQQAARPASHVDKENSVSQSENSQPALIEQGAAAGEWNVRVEKTWKGKSATGTVIVSADEKPGQLSKEQETLASGRAWYALGQGFLASGDAENAIECARQGIEAIGRRYASPMVADDTSLKLAAAQERIDEGHTQDGAEVMLRVLDTRTRLFADRNKLRLAD